MIKFFVNFYFSVGKSEKIIFFLLYNGVKLNVVMNEFYFFFIIGWVLCKCSRNMRGE